MKKDRYFLNGNFIYIYEEWLRMYKDSNGEIVIYTKEYKYFSQYQEDGDFYYRMKYDSTYSAFEKRTFCNYQDGKYYLENIIFKKNEVILSPELETKKKLGLHFYDDRRIHLPYELFVNEVTDIWEERTPIEGFKFDVEPIVYLKKDGVWLVEN